MASFDFIDAASKGYEFIWRERVYLFRTAIPVIFVKFLCLLAVFILGVQDQFLRQGLVIMPALFVEAIFIAALSRYFLYREPIFIYGRVVLVPHSGAPITAYQGRMSRKQCVQGAIAMYILIQVILSGLGGFMYDYMAHHPLPQEVPASAQNGSPLLSAVILFCIVALFTKSFRLFWLYIPIAMGRSAYEFFIKASGWRTPIAMLAASFVCTLPLITLFSAGLSMISEIFAEGSVVSAVFSALLQSIGELIISSVLVVAMTCGAGQILSGATKDK